MSQTFYGIKMNEIGNGLELTRGDTVLVAFKPDFQDEFRIIVDQDVSQEIYLSKKQANELAHFLLEEIN